VSRGIALLFLGPRHSRWGGGQPHAPAASTPGKDPVPIVQQAGWALWPVWTGGKSRPHRDSIPDRPARSSVATPTELPGPRNCNLQCTIFCSDFDGNYEFQQSKITIVRLCISEV